MLFEPNKNNTLLWLTDPINNFRCFKCKVLYEKDLDICYKEESIDELSSDSYNNDSSSLENSKDISYDELSECKKPFDSESSYTKNIAHIESYKYYKKEGIDLTINNIYKKENVYSDSVYKKECIDPTINNIHKKEEETIQIKFMNPTILLMILTFSLAIDWASPIICILIIYLCISLKNK